MIVRGCENIRNLRVTQHQTNSGSAGQKRCRKSYTFKNWSNWSTIIMATGITTNRIRALTWDFRNALNTSPWDKIMAITIKDKQVPTRLEKIIASYLSGLNDGFRGPMETPRKEICHLEFHKVLRLVARVLRNSRYIMTYFDYNSLRWSSLQPSWVMQLLWLQPP